VYLVVGGLVALLLVTAATSTVVRLRLNSSSHELSDTLRPAQIAVANLSKGYVDQETGERGYLLTRDTTFLQPYYSGEQETTRTQAQLVRVLAGDPQSRTTLAQIGQAATDWHRQVTEPEIQAAMAGTLSAKALADSVSLGKGLFDRMRTLLGTLQDHINQRTNAALQTSDSLQRLANDITIAAALAAALLAALAVWQIRTFFAVPLNQLVVQVKRVAEGDLDHSVDVSGPQEVATVAKAVETMRTRILSESALSATAGRQLARYEEAERIASSLGDTVIRQLFTTSLTLQSTAGRHPAVASVLTGAIADLDRALKDLQSAIFGLTAAPSPDTLGNQVLDLVDQMEAALGAAPDVQFDGSLDDDRLRTVVPDVVAVVREVLAAIVRPAAPGESTVHVSADDGELRLRITGGTSGDDDLVPARERAQRLGGRCDVQRVDGGVAVRWSIPLPSVTQPGTSRAGDS
jgi:CHASE3 domain sensor protein